MEIFCRYFVSIITTAEAGHLAAFSEVIKTWCVSCRRRWIIDKQRVEVLAGFGVFSKMKEEMGKKEHVKIGDRVWFLYELALLKQLDENVLTDSAQILIDNCFQLTPLDVLNVLFIYGSQKAGSVACVPYVLAGVSRNAFSLTDKLKEKMLVKDLLQELSTHRVYVKRPNLVDFVEEFALPELSTNMSWLYAVNLAHSVFVLNVQWPPLASALVKRAKEEKQSSALHLLNVCRYAGLCGSSMMEVCELLPSLVEKFQKEKSKDSEYSQMIGKN